ncbi:hypothetical protein BH18ACT4_BH18ACT4_12600 [soil metagenome]
MNVAVIYESLTGNTRRAAVLIGEELRRRGASVAVFPVTAIDYQALATSDLVIVGSWVDGLFVVGQRPGRASRLRKLPVLDRKRAVVFCTYALDAGRTLDKLAAIVEERGAEVLGGMTIRRDRLADGAQDFFDRVLGAVAAPS